MAQKRAYDEGVNDNEAESWNEPDAEYYYWDGYAFQEEHRDKMARTNQWVRTGYVSAEDKARTHQKRVAEMDALRRQIQILEQRTKIEKLKNQIKQQEQKVQREKTTLDQKQIDDKLAKEKEKERKVRIKRSFQQAFNVQEEVKQAPQNGKVQPLVASKEDVDRMLTSKSDYECLRVRAGECAAVIKKKYKELAMIFHPDKCQLDGAKEAFQRLNRAYGNLLRISR